MSVTMAARAHSGASLSAPVRRAQAARRKTSWLGRVARVAGKRPGRALVILAFRHRLPRHRRQCADVPEGAPSGPDTLHAAPVAAQPRATAERRAEPAPAAAAEVPVQPIRPPARPNDLSRGAAGRGSAAPAARAGACRCARRRAGRSGSGASRCRRSRTCARSDRRSHQWRRPSSAGRCPLRRAHGGGTTHLIRGA